MSARVNDLIFAAICLGALLANAAIFYGRATVYSEGDPDVLREARGIVRAFALYLGGLLTILMIGIALGLTQSPILDSRAKAITPFQRVYVALNALVFLRATWWVYAQDGAERLASHHRMFRFFPRTRKGVMVFWAALMCLLGYLLIDPFSALTYFLIARWPTSAP